MSSTVIESSFRWNRIEREERHKLNSLFTAGNDWFRWSCLPLSNLLVVICPLVASLYLSMWCLAFRVVFWMQTSDFRLELRCDFMRIAHHLSQAFSCT